MMLLIGSNGQLGTYLRKILPTNTKCFDYPEIDVTNFDLLEKFVSDVDIDLVINASAYTAVDKAEDEIERCYAINAEGVRNLALLCEKYKKKIIHVSTDYVFSGEATKPLEETDMTSPIGVYGASKLEGEKALEASKCDYIVIRTAWLYSKEHPSFLKTMMRLMEAKKEISVVADQYGTPTFVGDLAELILCISERPNEIKWRNLFHFSNEGECTWFDFASEIAKQIHSSCVVRPIMTDDYPTRARRPKYSVLSKAKVKKELGITIPDWKESLKKVFL